jgi:hypothetical protein
MLSAIVVKVAMLSAISLFWVPLNNRQNGLEAIFKFLSIILIFIFKEGQMEILKILFSKKFK